MRRDTSHSTAYLFRITQANVSQHADQYRRINCFSKLVSSYSCDAQSHAGNTAPNDPQRTYTCKLGGRGSILVYTQSLVVRRSCRSRKCACNALVHASKTAGRVKSVAMFFLFISEVLPALQPISFSRHSPQRWLTFSCLFWLLLLLPPSQPLVPLVPQQYHSRSDRHILAVSVSFGCREVLLTFF